MPVGQKQNLWDNLPEGWARQKDQPDHTQSSPPPPAPEERPDPPAKPYPAPPPERERKPPAPSNVRKQKKKALKDYQKQLKRHQYNDSENAKRAFQREKEENLRDYRILITVFALVIAGLCTAYFLLRNTSYQQIEDSIDRGDLVGAFHQIKAADHASSTLDETIYHFVDACVAAEDYKRAVSALEYLSEEANNQDAYFCTLVNTLSVRGKTARAEEVLAFMRSRGGALARAASELQTGE